MLGCSSDSPCAGQYVCNDLLHLGAGQDFSLWSIQGKIDSLKGENEKFGVSRRSDNPVCPHFRSGSKCFICSLYI